MNPMVPSPTQYETFTYQCSIGMNWIGWCGSEYNTNGFRIVETGGGLKVEHQYGSLLCDADLRSINANELIKDGGVYYYG